MKMRKTTTFTVKPAVKTARRSIPLTPLDMLLPLPFYPSVIYIYRAPAEGIVVNASALRESLSKVLVHFYPIAGRYRLIGNGPQIEIDCNDAGVLYVEAQTDSDLGDFAPSSKMSILVPTIEDTQDISSHPLIAVQVTYFNCGGVSIGLSIEHHCMDASSTFNFMCSWSEIARGLDISVLPFLDRASLIRPRNPPQPKFDHPEFLLLKPTTHVSQTNNQHLKLSIFKLAKEQLDEMKTKVGKQGHKYNTFEVVAGHIWKCVCKARGLGNNQETILMITTNARFNRWKPELPHNFFGNAILPALVVAHAGDLESKLSSEIHKTLVRIDSEFFRSVVDCLGLLGDSIRPNARPLVSEIDPNFHINSWAKLGLNDVDFGWGSPIYSGPAVFDFERAFIIPHDHDGSISVAIALRSEHMNIFHKLLYASKSEKNEKNLCFAKL